MKPIVSIIIPAKNEERNIERLLLSIKNQTYPRIETIVVDDGSIDNTISISKMYAKVYARKHLERSIQRNFGAKKSKGRYLLFLDADMELTPKVVEGCIKIVLRTKVKGVTIAERTVGDGFVPMVRKFEREMYMNDKTIEVPRFFEREVFFEFGGYDPELTGPEDYDLPYRIGKKYELGRTNEHILHHEEGVSLMRLLRKKYYYASHGARYAQKHPELIKTQGNTLFRKAYLKNWRKFLANPIVGMLFVVVRLLETVWAIAGYISTVGVFGFLRALLEFFLK